MFGFELDSALCEISGNHIRNLPITQ